MIAKNFRRFPDAMALQLVLAFGPCTWHTGRPTTRSGRALRAERSRLVKACPQIVDWKVRPVPSWWSEARKKAQTLAVQVKAACLSLVWDLCEGMTMEPAASFTHRLPKRSRGPQIDQFGWALIQSGSMGCTNWQHHGTGKASWGEGMWTGYRD